jgi:hypothetical protein
MDVAHRVTEHPFVHPVDEVILPAPPVCGIEDAGKGVELSEFGP